MLYDETTANLLFKGKDITGKIKSKYNNLFNEIEEIINSLKVEYSEDIYGLLDKIGAVRIEEPHGSQPQAKVPQAQEESLLENDAADEHPDSDHNHSNSGSFHQPQATHKGQVPLQPPFEARTSLQPDPKVEIRN